ncbi:MAG TPA: HAMP domain-containing sensor histidine kinase [Candidatus Baltobacteraceae bacterium]|jgi:two-component system OmpR family sensor kinase|nr:HAMP domain-containing sensor histidine kinase [Candidatus Baltobacteraceae bacterium]
MSEPFARFRRRITRSYVLLAAALVVFVAFAVTVLALLLYSRGINDALPGTAQRVTEAASSALQSGRTLADAAPQIFRAVGRSRFHITILDASGHRIASNEHQGPPNPGREIVIALGELAGLPRARVPVQGGTAVISADFDRFGELMLWYWSIMLPIGLIAILAAWLIGRRITSDAIGPLVDVTQALKVIAAGDFSPQRLPDEASDLRALTSAYNDVALSLAQASAERKETEAQMRQFIADAGHELRTPLTVVMGYLNALRQGIVQGAEGTAGAYETMLDESRKMRSLIERLILLARLDRSITASNPVTIDLGNVVRKAAASLAPLANGRIELSLPDAAVPARADESELYEAVKNVIENALKYAPESPVIVSLTRRDGEYCIAVEDRGPGMDPVDARHAFDRFYRGPSRGEVEGSGLGLAIAKRAVERAGGSASLQTEPGHGTRVVLCVPHFSAN